MNTFGSSYSFALDLARGVALSGGPWAGKSTLARYMRDHYSLYLIDTSARLKALAAVALCSIGVAVSIEDIEQHKQRYRPFLEELGTTMGMDDGEPYLKFFFYPVEQEMGTRRAVVDNVRTNEQALALQRHGFRTAELIVPAAVRRERAKALGVSDADFDRTLQHAVEQPLSPWLVDFRIPGELHVEAQAAILAELMGL